MSNNDQLLDLLDGKAPVVESLPTADNNPVPAAAPVAQEPVTPLAADAPPVTEPTKPEPTSEQQTPNTPAAAPVKSFDEELVQATNGLAKSREDLTALLEKSTRFTDLETQLQTAQAENSTLKAQAQVDPFANDFSKKLNDLYKGGANDDQIKAFMAINSLNIDGLSAIDAKVLRLQIENGISPEVARDYVAHEYKTDAEAYEEREVKNGATRLQVDHKKDLEFLRGHKAEVSTVPVDNSEQLKQEAIQKQNEHIQKLTPLAANAVSSIAFKGLSLNGKDGDGNVTADFDVSPESLQSLNATVAEYIKNNGANIPANEDGQKAIKNFAENVLVLQNYKNWIQHAAATRESQVRAEYHNPTPINRGKDNPTPVDTNREKLNQALLDSYR